MKTEKDGRPLIVGAIPPNLKILPYHEKAKVFSPPKCTRCGVTI